MKNPVGLLGAFTHVAAQVNSARLFLVGGQPRDPAFAARLAACWARSRGRDRIRLIGFQPHVAAHLAAADAVVVDSFYEGASVAATEAVSVGTPIVHSRCGSAEALCGPAEERGLSVANPAGHDRPSVATVSALAWQPEQPNTEDLARAMVRLASDRVAWSGRREEIAASAREAFGARQNLERTAAVLRAAAGERA